MSQVRTSSTTALPATIMTTVHLRWVHGPRYGSSWNSMEIIRAAMKRAVLRIAQWYKDAIALYPNAFYTSCLQAAKTYLERTFEAFDGATTDELVRHSLLALQATLQVWLSNDSATWRNCSIHLFVLNLCWRPPSHYMETGWRADLKELHCGAGRPGLAIHNSGRRNTGALHQRYEGSARVMVLCCVNKMRLC